LVFADFGCRWLSQLWRMTEPRPDFENLCGHDTGGILGVDRWGLDTHNTQCAQQSSVSRHPVMTSPMTLYHSLSPIPNTLYRCIRLYSESIHHGREGKDRYF
jgi:hypothetical protein